MATNSTVVNKRVHSMSLQSKRTLVAYGFLTVPLLFFLGIRIAPTLYAFALSLQARGVSGVTFANYLDILKDKVFWKAGLNTLLYVLITVPIQMGMGLILALAIEKVERFRWFYRMVYFIPYITSTVAVSWVWRLMYDPNIGLLDQVLTWFGIPVQGWLHVPSEALISVSIVMIWQIMGFNMLIFMAGIQSVPRHFYEAAEIDGAGKWQKFWHITFPLLNPTIVFLAITGVIQALQTFTQIENLTASSGSDAGGPLNSTVSIVVYMYQNGFMEFNMGLASATAVILFLFIFIVTLLQFRLLNRNYEY